MFLVDSIQARNAMRTRRDFGRLLLAGVPVAFTAAAKLDSTVKGVRLGVCSYSFRDLPRTPGQDNVDAIIRALQETGAGITELFAPNVEPASALIVARPGTGRPGGTPKAAGPPSAEEKAATRARMSGPEARKAREDLRQWRLGTPTSYFQAVRAKFDKAGIDVFAYTVNYRDDFTDDEIAK